MGRRSTGRQLYVPSAGCSETVLVRVDDGGRLEVGGHPALEVGAHPALECGWEATDLGL